MTIISTEVPVFVSLLAPRDAPQLPLSLAAARQLASFHVSAADATAALFDASGVRLQSTPNFDVFFGIETSPVIDRHRPADWRERWLIERQGFVHLTAESGRTLRVVEVASGYRVESTFATVQDEGFLGQVIMQTSRRIITCPPTMTGRPPEACNHAIQGTWGALEMLSKRQMEVLRLVTKGLGNDRIGDNLHRTKRAVEWHIRGLFAKLRLTDRVQLHLIGMRAGLADIPDDTWREMLDQRFV